MGIADPEAALAKLREFLALIAADLHDREDDDPRSSLAELYAIQPLIEGIASSIDPDNVGHLSKKMSRGHWPNGFTQHEAIRLIGILQQRADYERILGPVGPTLAANRLHRWVWNAAADLWDGGHFDSAVHKAALAVEEQTQLKLGRRDLGGKNLYSIAFSAKDPTADTPRLRFPHIDKTEQKDAWVSAHEGAQHLGMGCAQGIRNPQAHPSDDISEQEALEQLAALSVLARWVDACEVLRT